MGAGTATVTIDPHRRKSARAVPFRNEPLSDFSRRSARAAMRKGLEACKPYLGGWYSLIIGGRRLEPGSGSTRSTRPTARGWSAAAPGRCRSTPSRRSPRPRRRSPPGATRRRRSAPGCCSARPTSSAGGGSSWRAWEVYETGKQWREADARRRRGDRLLRVLRPRDAPPGRAPAARTSPARTNAYLLRAARRRRRHRAVELPAGHPLRHDDRAPLVTGNTVDHEARRAVAGRSAPS